MPFKGQRLTGKNARGVPRPHQWCTGPDPFKHSMYWPFQAHQAQAKFRGDEHTLTFEEFFEIWKNDWHNRGRQADNMCLTRIDHGGPWSKDNVELVTRQEHLERQGFYRQQNGSNRVPRGKGRKK